MIVAGIVVAALAAFVLSSVYYVLLSPVEQRALGDRALDRGKPGPAKIVAELLRTAIVAAGFAWIVDRSGFLSLPGALVPAVVLWVAFPLVLLTGSIIWERVPWQTAAIHAGDWLLKLVLIAIVLGLLH
ncbi:hypothetical protein AXK57_06960 [Tsukamurella pulmonis]|uniref:DUF1761 domain-containing protein n=1 Tax=Tsukamurella pulmonis TaxID=47312 RepID=A0A1H1CLV4_9ACTN|nr:DUF1761 domain-containing protein [Tsukamurella pulmonis]KXO89842.1 hypothetical protein AXK56_06705 [Tsukamurella pulmonis]KXP11098.1 hypothetical protein AXK57_06960 [Tsukamurella pulmonis]RDH10293.1 DUF1761 domain-containing protein [Tsukamurella pulmonis]SDQ65241.1 Protein of unknown function [Tsukamurella pulmonis]SUP23504.1 Uncharacterised protein [Tsukamurella pulmonis]